MTTPAVVERQLLDIDFPNGMSEAQSWETLDWTKYLRSASNLDFAITGKATVRKGWVSPHGMETSNSPLTIQGGPAYLQEAGALTPIGRLLSTDNGVVAISASTGINVSRAFGLDESGGSPLYGGGAWEAKERLSEYSVTGQQVAGLQSAGYVSGATMGAYGVCAAETTSYYIVAATTTSLPATAANRLYIIDKQSGNIVKSHAIEDTGSTAGAMVMTAVGDQVFMFYGTAGAGSFPYCLVWNAQQQAGTSLLSTFPTQVTLTVGNNAAPVACVPDPFDGSAIVLLSNGDMSRVSGTAGPGPAETATGVGVGAGYAAIHDLAITNDGNRNLLIVGLDAVPSLLVTKVNSSLASTGTILYGADPRTAAGVFSVGAYSTTQFRVVCSYSAPHPGGGAMVMPSQFIITYNGGWGNYCNQAGAGVVTSPFYNPTTGEFYGIFSDLPQVGLGSGHDNTQVTGNVVVANMGLPSTNAEMPWGPPQTGRPNALHISAICDRYVDFAMTSTTTGAMPTGASTQIATKVFTRDNGKTYVWAAIEKTGPTAYSVELRKLRLNDMTVIQHSSGAISGGKLHCYDGLTPSEYGFVVTPAVIHRKPALGVGLAIGSYNYVAVFEHVDSRGQRHFSRVSNPHNVTLAAADTPDIAFNFPVFTNHNSNKVVSGGSQATNYHVKIHLYRTTNGGTQYYRLNTYTLAVATASTQALVRYQDSTSDATLQTRELLHRQPGTAGTALDRYAAVAASCVHRHKDRLFYARGNTVYYSSFDVFGEAPWFNPAFSLVVPEGTGDITALGSIDGVLVIFKRNGIFVVDGDGPPENGGSGSEFTPPRKLMCEDGCIDQRSVVHTNEGIVFRSAIGLQILRRNLSVDFIGDAVQETVNSNPYTGGSAYDRSTGRAAWVVGSAEGAYPGLIATSGNVVVYDTKQKSWTTYSKSGLLVQDVVAADVTMSLASPAISSGQRFVFADSARAHIESGYLDAVAGVEAFVPYTFTTGWVRTNSKQDRLRVSDFTIGGKYVSPFTLTSQYAVNYYDSFTTVKTWTRYGDLISSAPVPQFEVQPPKELVQSMAFKITTSSPSPTALGTGQQMDIFALTVKAGLKGGGAKLASAQRG